MAFVVSGLSEYTAKATEILTAGILFNDNFAEFEVQTGIKHKEYLNFLDSNPILVAGACGATDSGSTTLTEKEITVYPMKADQRFCYRDLYQKALNDEQVAKSITTDSAANIANQISTMLWSGSTLGVTGWVPAILADSTVTDLNLSATTLTVDNVVASGVTPLINAITDGMRSRGVLTIYCSYSTYNLYKQNRLASNMYHDSANLGDNEMWVFGYENSIKIKPQLGIGDLHMILTWAKNLVIGRDEVNEVTSAKWVLDEITEYAWLKTKTKIGTQIKFGSEIISRY